MFKKIRRSRTAVVGVCCALAGAAAVPVISLAGSISGSTGDGPMVLQSGESTPGISVAAGVSSLPSTYNALWSRNGDTVTMSGVFTATPSAGGTRAAVYLDLPIDSNINSYYACHGTATVNGTGGYVPGGAVGAGTATGHTHQCLIEWTALNTSTANVHFSLTYRVRD
jgi:hypothetical protein